jgi:hypothetical protein
MKPTLLFVVIVATALVFTACGQTPNPTTSNNATSFTSARAPFEPPPAGLVNVDAFGNTLAFWPFTGTNFSGAPQDPVNLIFVGYADPRDIRAALLSLDGDRTAFGVPDAFPFNSTWRDAIGGDMQTAYGASSGWVGGAIQLECGDYRVLRFHLRLFSVGDYTLGNAHIDLAVPNTTAHQVISWEVAESLLVVDMLRSGLLDDDAPIMPTPQINPAPFRGIPAMIYNAMPPELRALAHGPAGDVTDSVPIFTDGTAAVFNLADVVSAEPGTDVQEFVINFAQMIPKPFCASGPFDFIYVEGPVLMKQTTTYTPSGNLITQFQASGSLKLTPMNPLTDPPTPIGETYDALVNQHDRGSVTDQITRVSSFQLQIELPSAGPFRGRLMVKLNVGPGEASSYDMSIDCEP